MGAGMEFSARAVLLTVLLVLSAEDVRSQSMDTTSPAEIELAVYGSGSFKEGLSVGDIPYVSEKGYSRLMVTGGQSELAFHDRNEVACTPAKRWNLYASEASLRSHRPGGNGGFIISEDMTRFLQDLNIGGVIDTKTLALSGVGDRRADSPEGEPLLLGSKQLHHLKFGYNTGHSWIQSVKSHLALNPQKEQILIGTTIAQKRLTVDPHLRVDDKLTVGGSSSAAFLSETHMQFARGGGWYMTDTAYLKSINDLPAYTKGAGKFMGNVGIGTLPKFPIFRLQVHQPKMSEHGAVMVTDKADRGLTLAQTKEGALLRSWNIDTKKHEALLVEAGPLLIQPRSGIVLFGTTVRKKQMHLHIKGNLYIHGHMFAMKNLHVKDHANLKHLLMPSISLKNKPQSADGDTLVLGHMKKKKEENAEAGPWETPGDKKIITGINLRFGFHNDYTWIQVHGKEKGKHMPLALNPLGNNVAIGTVNPDKRYQMHAEGNGYVLGTLFVKMEGTGGEERSMEEARIRDYSQLATDLSDTEALSALRESRVARLAETEEAKQDLLKSSMSLISVSEKLGAPADGTNHASVNRLTSMMHKVLRQQAAQMAKLDATVEKQASRIAELRAIAASR